MAEIIELARFRRKVAADQGFRTWLRRFREQFGPDTRLRDLSDQTLLFLATPGDENLFVFFDLVMGALGYGTSVRIKLDELDDATTKRVLDVSLGLLDRSRFELMRRLGWVESVPGEDVPLITLLQEAERQVFAFDRQTPRLSPRHPDFAHYLTLDSMDRNAFLRRLIPMAIQEFRRLLEQSGRPDAPGPPAPEGNDT